VGQLLLLLLLDSKREILISKFEIQHLELETRIIGLGTRSLGLETLNSELETRILEIGLELLDSKLDIPNSKLNSRPVVTRSDTPDLSSFTKLPNSLARVVLQRPRRTHAEPLLRSLHWLPVEHRVTYQLAVLTFNVLLTATPAYLNSLISNRLTASGMSLRSSTRSLMAVPRKYYFSNRRQRTGEAETRMESAAGAMTLRL